MVTRLLMCSVVFVATVAAAAAQDAAKEPAFRAGDYPIEVRKSLSNAVLTCRQADDGKVTFAPDTVRRVDLTGDGREDYIVSLRNTKCSSFPFIYCGTGGCELDIIVALPGGKHRKVFSNRVRGHEILPGSGGRTISFDMHGGYCGKSGPAECIRKRRITTKPFVIR